MYSSVKAWILTVMVLPQFFLSGVWAASTFPSYTNDATHKSVDLQVASRQACRCGRRRPPEEGRQEHPFLPAEEGSVPGGLRRGPRSPQDLHGRTGTRGAQPHPTQPGAHR